MLDMADHLAYELSVPMLLHTVRSQHMSQHVLSQASQGLETTTEFGGTDPGPVDPAFLKKKKEWHRARAGWREHRLQLRCQFGRKRLRGRDQRMEVLQVATQLRAHHRGQWDESSGFAGVGLLPLSRSMTSRLSTGSVTGRWPVAAISIHSVYRL